ncbi:lactococcin 972 family bacteriocin [Streptococcus loxodontisalivarius]|uniref:Lactococcin 972 family bacteriocin n=1 Tax=Streptococcus loxodontisalivarius TaxID=1349415 RepID=A0ABS2PS84_9STRE|nr:lactococcin 972 family bacteriocin [Streptococcus loxodontisalivarius]MBM7642247.1 lactococcin 972 family bacteriocin [Streptococcus loxodontisalivarius]
MEIKRFIISGAIVSLLALGVSTTVSAGTSWDYGYGVSTAYSNYYHSHRSHGAKVVNKNTGRVGIDNKGAGAWAKAVVGRNVTEKASFYYNNSTY